MRAERAKKNLKMGGDNIGWGDQDDGGGFPPSDEILYNISPFRHYCRGMFSYSTENLKKTIIFYIIGIFFLSSFFIH